MLGPADGRYVVRPAGTPEASPSHVLVLATVGAPERRRLTGRRRRDVPPEPEPTPVATSRATVIGAEPVEETAVKGWLADVGPKEVAAGLAVVNRALAAHRIAAADPRVREVSRSQALVVRAGYGPGEQVADGRWTAARELPPERVPRQRRAAALRPQERLAALLGARDHPLACEELILRARLDLDAGRLREAALQLLPALDAAVAELPPTAALAQRTGELRGRRDDVGAAARAALSGPLGPEHAETVSGVLARLEAALRARAVETG